MNLTYKCPLKIDKIYNLKMEIEKIKFKSVFINCLIYDEKQNKYTTSIIIKEIIPKLKL
jgi:acyl-CoA thioesterase FadM